MRLHLFIDNVKSADEGNYTCYAEKQSSFNEYKIQLKTGVCVCVCVFSIFLMFIYSMYSQNLFSEPVLTSLGDDIYYCF